MLREGNAKRGLGRPGTPKGHLIKETQEKHKVGVIRDIWTCTMNNTAAPKVSFERVANFQKKKR